MARNGKKNERPSPAKDLVDLITRLAWWVGVLIAFVSSTALRRYAYQPGRAGAGGGSPADA